MCQTHERGLEKCRTVNSIFAMNYRAIYIDGDYPVVLLLCTERSRALCDNGVPLYAPREIAAVAAVERSL